MIEVEREDFFVESIKNPLEYGTYYKINQKYGIGFQWTSEVHHDFVITVTDIRFNQETMVGEHIGPGYVLALYISGAGDEFYRIKMFLRIHCAAMNHLKSTKLFIILRFH